MGNLTDRAVNAVIRPPRRIYRPADLPVFLAGCGCHAYVRHPVTMYSPRGDRVVGSIYIDSTRELMNGGPCVVYLHGNVSCQSEGQFLIQNVCPRGVALYLFEFSACGASGGQYISLGHFERQDVNHLLSQLEATFGLGPFVLWGRSMGASTAILLNHPSVVGKIIDSSFTTIPDVIASIASYLNVWPILMPAAVFFLRQTILARAHFDIRGVSPLERCWAPDNVPMVMCHAEDDEFIPIEQGLRLFDAYSNPNKRMVVVRGGHNGRRSLRWIGEACKFAFEMLGIGTELFKAVRFEGMDDEEQHFRSYAEMVRFVNERAERDAPAGEAREQGTPVEESDDEPQ
jgi:pimeloyl-ACP methyl ester carboxylesterase